MKSVMLSIQPKWVAKITSGKKTIEVRKTRPKLETPFKCYIYCTKKKRKDDFITISGAFGLIRCLECAIYNRAKEYDCNGKVIGEFVCDKIDEYLCEEYEWEDGDVSLEYRIRTVEGLKTCLEYDEVREYGNEKPLYFWHISDLVIYDKPKELSEFKAICNKVKHYETESKDFFDHCLHCEYLTEKTSCLDSFACGKFITGPAQSWCYVESLGE